MKALKHFGDSPIERWSDQANLSSLVPFAVAGLLIGTVARVSFDLARTAPAPGTSVPVKVAEASAYRN